MRGGTEKRQVFITRVLRPTARLKPIALCVILFAAACSQEGDGLPDSRTEQASGQICHDRSLGINIHWDYTNRDRLKEIFSDLQKMGCHKVRMDWEWRQVEMQQGTYDWTVTDWLMETANAFEIDIYPMVLYPPDWAFAADRQQQPGHFTRPPAPENYVAYAAFVAASIARYGPDGDAPIDFRPIPAWEIWNEPNHDDFWSPKQDYREYVELLKTTASTVRTLFPDIQLVHGGLATADYVWILQCYQLDENYGQYFDVLSVHPYFIDPATGPRTPCEMDEVDDDGLAALGFIGSVRDPGFFGKVYNLRNLMHLMSDPNPDKPIWITEVGFFVGDIPGAIDPAGHAQRMRQTVEYAWEHFTTEPYLDLPLAVNAPRLFWFNYQDYGDQSLPGSWGLLDQEGNRRPAYEAFIRVLGDVRLALRHD